MAGEIMKAFRHFEKSPAQTLYLVGSSVGPRVLEFAPHTLGLQFQVSQFLALQSLPS